MALVKTKTLPSGESGDYWRVSYMTFSRRGMKVGITLSLYKNLAAANAGAPPLPTSYDFAFTVTQPELAGNLVSLAYTKIKAAIAELHTPVSGSGDPVSYYPDLVGAVDG